MWSLRFDQTIGAGAFGTVYLAKLKNEAGLRRPVAVKMIAQGHADSEMFLTRMRDEARLLGMLRDPYVLQVLDLINLEGRDAIVLEYVNGADLDAVLQRSGPIPLKPIVEIGAVISGALDRAHRAVHPKEGTPLGVVHRDVKPANIMLTGSGDLRLLDFGVARARFAARESSTGQLVLGTLNYMAPDYIITGEVRPALDVYGLALTLWELATAEVFGQPKVREDSHAKRLDTHMGALRPTYAILEPLLRRMLSWQPEQRPDAGEVAVALQAMLPSLEGAGLLDFAQAAVPPILADRPETPDTEGLIGRRFQIAPPPGAWDNEPTLRSSQRPKPQFRDGPTVKVRKRPDRADAAPRPHSPTDHITDVAEPGVLTRHLQDSNSVTISATSSSGAASPPSRSSRKAILGGAVIGGLVGILAVAGMAILLLG